MNKTSIVSFAVLASVSVCPAAHAQDKTPVVMDTTVEHSIATNGFWQNWELSLGLQGLSFYSNQENAPSLPSSPLKGYRVQLGLSASVAKWFSPDIALRTKGSGFWGRKVQGYDKKANAVKYFSLHEDVLVNLTNILYGYKADRSYNFIPYGGVGATRNFSDNENALTLHLGLLNTLRLSKRVKAFCDLSFNITGDEFDGVGYNGKNIIKNHDRWLAGEVGLSVELGRNQWKRAVDLDAIEVVPWAKTQAALRDAESRAGDLAQQLEECESRPAWTVRETVSETPEVSVFFEIGSSELTHRGQLENVRRLVQTAIKEGRTVVVSGFADSTTGNEQYNQKLSARRADTIAAELIGMGLSADKIKRYIGGGVDTLNPYPANRRVVVSLGDEIRQD